MRQVVLGDGNAESKLCGAKVCNFPFQLQLCLEGCQLLWQGHGGKNVIHMDREDDGSKGGRMVIDAPFAGEALETKGDDLTIEGDILDSASLFYAIDAF